MLKKEVNLFLTAILGLKRNFPTNSFHNSDYIGLKKE